MNYLFNPAAFVAALLFFASCSHIQKEEQEKTIPTPTFKEPEKVVVKKQDCDPTIISDNERAAINTSAERSATMYLHWQVQRETLLQQERKAYMMGTLLSKALTNNDKDSMIKIFVEYNNDLKSSKAAIVELKTLDELIPLNTLIYSYYCYSTKLFDSAISILSKSDSLAFVRVRLGKIFTESSEVDAVKMGEIGGELKRLNTKYHMVDEKSKKDKGN